MQQVGLWLLIVGVALIALLVIATIMGWGW
jgi:hypothetical protein